MSPIPLPREGPRRRETPAWLCFAAVIAIFTLQCIYLRKNAEPYPALVLPSFSGIMLDHNGAVTGASADVIAKFTDGSTKTINMQDLFAAAPSSHWQFMSKIMFYPKSGGVPGNAGSALKGWIKTHLLPGFVLSRERRHTWNGVDGETREWLDAQLEKLYPGETVAAATIDWFNTTYTQHDGQWQSRRTETKRVEVPF